jgi:hypothetical protein
MDEFIQIHAVISADREGFRCGDPSAHAVHNSMSQDCSQSLPLVPVRRQLSGGSSERLSPTRVLAAGLARPQFDNKRSMLVWTQEKGLQSSSSLHLK